MLVSIIKFPIYLIYFTRKFPSVDLRGKDGLRILLNDMLGKKARVSEEGPVVLGSGKGESGLLVGGGWRADRSFKRHGVFSQGFLPQK